MQAPHPMTCLERGQSQRCVSLYVSTFSSIDRDGRYGRNYNKCSTTTIPSSAKTIARQYQRVVPRLIEVLGVDPRCDIRFVEDSTNPTLGAWGLGWGMYG
ncbi:glycine--tRNA ligase subunit alpha [Vibrio chagasii]|nr:glycine--tRNA ligase subunit alpha [Vibrio chagasii]